MAADYTVTDQRPVTVASAGGVFVPSMEITFVTKPSGQPGRVTVPNSQYTPAHVDEILTTAARNIEAVHAL
ncbi:MAG TPA: hypothetical protein VFO15_18020 [Xanthobacteraceae bacterium]|nr:hypothetical protein [Xanthobacteraceae bacterium]